MNNNLTLGYVGGTSGFTVDQEKLSKKTERLTDLAA